MPELRTVMRPAYYAPTARRYYFTQKAAAGKEASAMIRRKYPTERGDDGDGGFHWSGDYRLRTVHARLTQRILRALVGARTGESNGT